MFFRQFYFKFTFIFFLLINFFIYSSQEAEDILNHLGTESFFDQEKNHLLVKLSFEIKDGFHLNSDKPLQEFLIGTDLQFLENDKVLENIKISYPERQIKEINGDKVSWFSGKIDFFAIIKNKKNTDKIKFQLNYQGCTDEGQCYIPVKITKELSESNIKVVSQQDFVKTFRSQFGSSFEEDESSKTTNKDSSSQPFLLAMLFFAFLGGIILNFMPCVLPIFSLKIYGLVSKKETKKERITISIFYTFGILFCFLLLWIFIASLLSLGKSIGWGFHFQDPIFVTIITIVVLLVMLNQWDIFPTPAFGMNQDVNSNKSLASKSFFEGLFISVMSTSCSAPLLSVAVSFAVSQSLFVIALIFLSIGIGFATPMVALYWFTWLRKIFPKPGAWLVLFKTLIGFSLLAVLIWLSTVFYQLSDWVLYQRFLWLLFLITLFSTLYSFMVKKKPNQTLLFFSVLMLVNIIAVILFFRFEKKKELWQPLNQQTYSQYIENKSNDKIVFIDFTAAWCFTCQFNKKWILENKEVKEFFTEKKVILLRADMTKKSEYLTNLLEQYDRKSIPVYIIYGKQKDKQPIVIDFLTKDKLIKKITKVDEL